MVSEEKGREACCVLCLSVCESSKMTSEEALFPHRRTTCCVTFVYALIKQIKLRVQANTEGETVSVHDGILTHPVIILQDYSVTEGLKMYSLGFFFSKQEEQRGI